MAGIHNGAEPVTRVALVGLPGAGKSAVAASLARRLGWRLVDTDALVEAAAGTPVGEIFAAEGEAGFRRRELEALREAFTGEAPTVIAAGGGMLSQPEAAAMLLQGTCAVWLDAPDSVLLNRVGSATDRPLLRDDPAGRLATLRSARAGQYGRASLRVDCGDGDVEEIVDRVVDAIAGTRLPTSGDAAVDVDLDRLAYPVLVRRGAVADLAGLLPAKSGRVAVVVDRAAGRLGRQVVKTIEQSGRRVATITLTGDEQVKTWSHAGRLLDRFAALELDRDDCAVAVGGGSVGDLCGFAAAVYMRGIACLQVPTTLLAMVDSALGGKTAVNLSAGKNLVGAFAQPRAVVCDLDALEDLPERPYRSALSEVVKYAMAVDGSLAPLLEEGVPQLLARDPEVVAEVVRRCCALKAEFVAGDEREAGRRAVLNYGHTVGHALEALTGYGDALLHGEAVAAGMRVAADLSARALGCPAADVAWQNEMLTRCGLPGAPPLHPDAVLERTRLDKKSRGGVARWVLLERRGAARYGQLVPEEMVRESLTAVLAA